MNVFARLSIAFGSIGRCIAAIDSVEYVNGLFPAAKRLPLLHAIAACVEANDVDGGAS